MKCFMFLLMITFSSLAFGVEPYPLSGSYQFTGEISQSTAITYKPVYVYSKKAQEQLGKLKAKGYTCKGLPRNTYLCHLFTPHIAPSTKASNKAQAHFSNFSHLSFGQVMASSAILTEGEQVIIFRVWQSVTVNGQIFPHYDYQIYSGSNAELHKIILEQDSQRLEFIVRSSTLIEKSKIINDQLEFGYIKFLLSGLLNKQ